MEHIRLQGVLKILEDETLYRDKKWVARGECFEAVFLQKGLEA